MVTLPGRGALPYNYVHCGYVPLERPPFSALNFRSRAYHFHKYNQKKKSTPEAIIFKMSLPSSRSFAAHGRLLQPARTRSVLAAPRGYSRPECQPDASYKSAPETPIHARARSRAPHFHARAAPEPPIFTLPWHIPTKMWAEYPPPPPPPPRVTLI